MIGRWYYAKARRFLGVDLSQRWGWLMRSKWPDRLREIGLNPETLEIIDSFRWSVAWDMIHDADHERTFPIEEFRRRLAIARSAADELVRDHSDYDQTESAPQDESRRVVLESFGIELE